METIIAVLLAIIAVILLVSRETKITITYVYPKIDQPVEDSKKMTEEEQKVLEEYFSRSLDPVIKGFNDIMHGGATDDSEDEK